MRQRKRVDESNISEFIGQKFWNLTILDYIPRKDKSTRLKVKCLCDCGNECIKEFNEIRNGNVKSCGCRISSKKTAEDYQEYIGKRYNRLVILEYVGKNKDGRPLMKCQCDCGNITVTTLKGLKSGKTKGCGCRISVIKTAEDYQEYIGKKYNRLTILEYAGRRNDGHPLVKCLCECGNTTIINLKDAKSGLVKSCGCLQREISKNNFKIDGRTEERTYTIYMNMKARCYNKNNPNYKNYGGRGIKICDEWLDDYLNFKNWAINNGYSDDLTIDRIDVNGNYEPNNCRWADIETQANNRRDTIYLTYNGETHNIAEWSKITGIDKNTIRNRNYRNMPIEKILCPDN